MKTEKRITIQFILICLVHVLNQAKEQEYMQAVKYLQRSRLPEFLINNLIRTTDKLDE